MSLVHIVLFEFKPSTESAVIHDVCLSTTPRCPALELFWLVVSDGLGIPAQKYYIPKEIVLLMSFPKTDLQTHVSPPPELRTSHHKTALHFRQLRRTRQFS
jgi:hypothetical protein